LQTRLEAPATDAYAAQEQPAVLARGVSRRYDSRGADPISALEGIDLQVRTGEVLGVLGPSGCGKSTLLELIAGLQDPDDGEVSVEGRSAPAERLERCAYMPQRDLLLPWRDAAANAALALESQGISRREARRRALPLLRRFDLAQFEHSLPSELSGGMRQRVAFVRTLLAGRPVLLLDEPFAALDSITRAGLQEWLAEALAAEARTVVLVTHDVDEALYLSDRVVTLTPRPGRVETEIEVAFERPRPRRETVTDPAFAALRAEAMEALEC
jgi:NitT/TauT family transport system ATP-binding protein